MIKIDTAFKPAEVLERIKAEPEFAGKLGILRGVMSCGDTPKEMAEVMENIFETYLKKLASLTK